MVFALVVGWWIKNGMVLESSSSNHGKSFHKILSMTMYISMGLFWIRSSCGAKIKTGIFVKIVKLLIQEVYSSKKTFWFCWITKNVVNCKYSYPVFPLHLSDRHFLRSSTLKLIVITLTTLIMVKVFFIHESLFSMVLSSILSLWNVGKVLR